MSSSPRESPKGDDIPYVVTLLGRVLSSQLGESGFARVEAIRRTSHAFQESPHGSEAESALARELDALLDVELPVALDVIRSFSYYSQLLNIAEDVPLARGGQRGEKGSLVSAFSALRSAGVRSDAVRSWLKDACISPVLTAHPTEVQRRSILEVERELGRTLLARERVGGANSAGELAALDAHLFRLVLRLWQTAMLRLVKLTVADEVNNALNFYARTFVHAVPAVYADIETGLATLDGAVEEKATAAVPTPAASPARFLTVGSWIGGDRDGNPFVNAETLRYAVNKQGAIAFEHYLTNVAALDGELSCSARLIKPSADLTQLAANAGEAPGAAALPYWAHIKDEPYRASRARSQHAIEFSLFLLPHPPHSPFFCLCPLHRDGSEGHLLASCRNSCIPRELRTVCPSARHHARLPDSRSVLRGSSNRKVVARGAPRVGPRGGTPRPAHPRRRSLRVPPRRHGRTAEFQGPRSCLD